MKTSKTIADARNIAIRACMLIACMFFGMTASAQDKEIIPIELGEHTTTKVYPETNYYSFVAPMTGTLTISANGDLPDVYSDATFETKIVCDWLGYGIGLGRAQSVNVAEGTTYYLSLKPLDQVTFDLKLEASDAKPEIEHLTPAEGSVFNATGDGLIGIRFTKSINYSVAKIATADAEVEIDGVSQNGIYAFDIKKTLFAWLNEQVLTAGDEFIFIMEGVCDASDPSVVYGEDGTVVVKYIAPEMPVVKVSETVPTNFLSYWVPGDERGIITLTFSGELSDGATTKLTWGNSEAENELYIENVPTTITGNTITIDLTDKLRTPQTMLPNSTTTDKYTSMQIQINNIRDTKGNYCYAEGQGSLGSFGWRLDYKIVSGNLVYEFTPGNGKSLNGVNSIELWINDASLIHSYGGINVKYTADNEDYDATITKDKLTSSVEYGELIINIPVDEAIQKASNVTVALSGAVFTDGLEREIKASYNTIDSGIDTTTADIDSLNGTFDVYAADGRLVMKNAKKGSLNRLAAGLYIVDSRKLIIK